MGAAEWAMCLLAVGVLGIVGIVAWNDSQAPTFELRKEEWFCTAEREETRLRPQLAGKFTIMVPYAETVCDRWDRRP